MLLAGIGCMAACGGLSHRWQADVRVSRQVNQLRPVAVDVVAVYSSSLFSELNRMPAREWFEHKKVIDSKRRKRLEIWSWEWVPGQLVAPIERQTRMRPRALLVFALYRGGESLPEVLTETSAFRIDLQRDSLVVTPLAGEVN